ncbi:GIY-YIG nuclease family protein [Curtobacterium sp. MR_MD2014]|uniref:GIY-YIG nuclease family protein n=1 Tax=Curtobacterium sp. MR_MD2014 TaxID=1561023 RepID=UPI00082FEAB2|nr:GIY-YIG nuclease family protein [Curtobacterium sp. MR_MD2014]
MSLVVADVQETVGGGAQARRLYAYTIPGRKDQEWQRETDAGLVHGVGVIKVGETTKPTARQRIHQQLNTAYPGLIGVDILLDDSAVRTDGSTFRDYDVHRALAAAGIRRVGGEWFEATLDEVKAAVSVVRGGRRFDPTRTLDFGMRPEQEEAVAETASYFLEHRDDARPSHYLWNAKMRFGKTFTTYQLAREMEWSKVLVLTYKPAVHGAWKDDLLGHVDFEGWEFVDATVPVSEAVAIADGTNPFVWFASFQDLSGRVEGAVKQRNEPIHLLDWDVIIIDEYHFGAWRESARELYDPADKKLAEAEEPEEQVTEADLALSSRNYLYLSGTPFRAITNGEFSETQVYNWTYIDEQRNKEQWPAGRGDNPYIDLPRMEMYTYRMSQTAEEFADDGEFNGFSLNEYFRARKVEGGGRNDYEFAEPTQVAQFLDMLRGKLAAQMKTELLGAKPPFPYEDQRFSDAVRHSVWYMNDVASCFAMKALLEKHPFYSGFVIHVAAGGHAGQGAAAKLPVDEAIHKAESEGKSGSITLSCGKLMTGVTIKKWASIFMLRSLKSPESYFQAAFRVQSPWSDVQVDQPRVVHKDTCYVFEFDPNRALSLLAEYGTRLATGEDQTTSEVLGELINYLPIFAFDGGRMQQLDATDVLNWATAGIGASALASRWNSPLLVNINESTLTRLLDNADLLASLEQIEDFRNLSADVQKVITSTQKLKAAKREKPKGLGEGEKKEKKETTKLRTELRKKLQKFVARVPVFMYLTDFREEALTHVIRSLDPALFERVTGLTIADFEMLAKIGVFNANYMDAAIWQFRQFENASLRYADEIGVDVLTAQKVGLWEKSVDAQEVGIPAAHNEAAAK